jgi:hypothetical protein
LLLDVALVLLAGAACSAFVGGISCRPRRSSRRVQGATAVVRL